MFSLPSFISFALPSLSFPTVSLPVNIQRRFLSFVLRRALGHLVKPDQLHVDQIEAQIGDGRVEIKELELNSAEVNKLLADLPVQLQDGAIGKISARIPWPNIFTAPFSLAVDSLQLSLVLKQTETEVPQTSASLSDSVTFAAEAFLHDELSSRETEELRNSLLFGHDHIDEEDFRMPPGSIDPFMHGDEKLNTGYQQDDDLQGVSVFATLMERLLARFSFTLTNTKISILHEGVAEFSLVIPDISYSTETRDNDADGGEDVRVVKISGVEFAVRDAFGPHADESSQLGSAQVEESHDNYQASESVSSLLDSSMYHSFTTATGDPQPDIQHGISHHPPNQPPREPRSETILSFSSEPIVIQVVNTRPATEVVITQSGGPLPNATPNSGRSGVASVAIPSRIASISISVEVPAIGIALTAAQLGSLISTTTLISSSPQSPKQDDVPDPLAGNLFGHIEAKVNIRGIVVLLLQDAVEKQETLAQFFRRPTSPPLETRHLRLHIDKFVISLDDALFLPSIPGGTNSPPHLATRQQQKQQLQASISDMSLFAIRYAKYDGETRWYTSPILIFDQNLKGQYDPTASSFPVFEVTDWRRNDSMSVKTSQWKTRISSSSKRRPSFLSPGAPAINVQKEVGSPLALNIVEVNVQPVQVLVDLEVVGEIIQFAMHCAPQQNAKDQDPNTQFTSNNKPSRGGTRRTDGDKAAASSVVIECLMVRLQLRAPPPRAILNHPRPARSGVIVVDLYSMKTLLGSPEADWEDRPPPVRFSSSTPLHSRSKKLLAEMKWERILLSVAAVDEPRASGCIVVGPLAQALDPASFSLPEHDATPHPKISIRTSSSAANSTSSISLECQMPSAQVLITKSVFDSVQLLADDASQWAERAFGETTSPPQSQDTSIIGSRYFAQQMGSMGSLSTAVGSKPTKPASDRGSAGEIVISLVVLEAGVSLMVPRGPVDGPLDAHPVAILFSDLDMLVEVKPEGKNETHVTLTVSDSKIVNSLPSGVEVTLLERTLTPGPNIPIQSMLKLRLVSCTDVQTGGKESMIRLHASAFTLDLSPDKQLISDLQRFTKAPDGVFESVIPNERTRISTKIQDGSLRFLAPPYPGALLANIKELELSTELVGDSVQTEIEVFVRMLRLMFIDDARPEADAETRERIVQSTSSYDKWKKTGYALLAELSDLSCRVVSCTAPATTSVDIQKGGLRLHACADTLMAVGQFSTELAGSLKDNDQPPPPPKRSKVTAVSKPTRKRNIFDSLDDEAFKQAQGELGPSADMINDDLPSNLDYLDSSFGAAGGFREFSDSEFELSGEESSDGVPQLIKEKQPSKPTTKKGKVLSEKGGETIRLLIPGHQLRILEDYYDPASLDPTKNAPQSDRKTLQIQAQNVDVRVYLYDGYDWASTRKAIEDEVKSMRRKLQKIRQLLASGQVPDDSVENTHAVLFNSVHIGLPMDADELETPALIQAIDDQLNNDDLETASQSSWQSLNRPRHSIDNRQASGLSATKPRTTRVRGKRLTRSKGSRIEIALSGIQAEVDQYELQDDDLSSRVLVTVQDAEILDHIKTSTWKKFLTGLNRDSRGNVRETDSNMLRLELKTVRPVRGVNSDEARLKAKILPLRLHVDQDALDFLKAFFSFSPNTPSGPPKATDDDVPEASETYFQHVEIFPVGLKLDYKPKRVDYKALREGRTIELMNFFHFDGAEMTLRHITLNGITGWARLGDTLNDLWTPDVKANQLADVISGISPIRSVVNVGSGVADLVLLPIAQYKKDKRLVRGLQKGTTSFVQTTAMEAVKLGAKLATGTQVILEQAEHVLGGGPSDLGRTRMVTEVGEGGFQTLDVILSDASDEELGSEGERDHHADVGSPRSKYAHQPGDVKEGMTAAYKSLGRNLNSAAQTILAVPMEVYERSGNEGAVRKVVRAVPIAVLKPMIGASEAVSKTLLGLRNTLDPDVIRDLEGKYKR